MNAFKKQAWATSLAPSLSSSRFPFGSDCKSPKIAAKKLKKRKKTFSFEASCAFFAFLRRGFRVSDLSFYTAIGAVSGG